MSEGVNQPLVLRKKSRSSRFASWSGDANRFYDKMLRVFYIFLLFAIDFAMFIYSINGKLIEGGTFNQAVLFICLFVCPDIAAVFFQGFAERRLRAGNNADCRGIF